MSGATIPTDAYFRPQQQFVPRTSAVQVAVIGSSPDQLALELGQARVLGVGARLASADGRISPHGLWRALQRALCRPILPAPTASRRRRSAGWRHPALSGQARQAREEVSHSADYAVTSPER